MSVECRICGENFEAKTARRKLCDKCQKNSKLAQFKEDIKILESKANLGDLFSQQYHKCTCNYCGKEFIRYGKVVNFCTTECRQQYTAENAKCRVCSTLLYPLGLVAKNGQGCCSDKCKEEYSWTSAKVRGRVGKCKFCTKEFIQKSEYAEFCCSDCRVEYKQKTESKKDVVMQPRTVIVMQPRTVIVKCAVCGNEFERSINAKQYTCGKACGEIRTKRILKEKNDKLKAERNSEKEIARNPDAKRKELVDSILKGKLTGVAARKAHLCTSCRTSQAQCIMFQSRFTYHPDGTVIKSLDGHNVVLVCPQYNG